MADGSGVSVGALARGVGDVSLRAGHGGPLGPAAAGRVTPALAARLAHDAARIAGARSRAVARGAAAASPSPWRFAFRTGAPRRETAEQRRRRVRDGVLIAGGDPAAWPNAQLALAHFAGALGRAVELVEPDRFEELDGVGARAARYRADLARGRWQLPHDLQHPIEPARPKEARP